MGWTPFKNSPSSIGEPFQLDFQVFARRESKNQIGMKFISDPQPLPVEYFTAMHSISNTLENKLVQIIFEHKDRVKVWLVKFNELSEEYTKLGDFGNKGIHENALALVYMNSFEADTEKPCEPTSTRGYKSGRSSTGSAGSSNPEGAKG